MSKTDLHTHTTASDGDYTPSQLIELAAKQGVTVLAITDHDTTAGVRLAQAAADAHRIRLIPGIELSAETPANGDIHMLGYFIDIDNPTFQAQLQQLYENRYRRGQAMVRKLNELGVPLTVAAVEAAADGAPITRPHIAQAMVAEGFVPSMSAAFSQYISPDGPAYVGRKKFSPQDAIQMIHAVGGVAIMAHPGLVPTYREVLPRLIAAGVDGIEQHHPDNGPEVVAYVQAITSAHGLIATGGSDFHRPQPDGSLRLGTINPPADAVNRLQAITAQPPRANG